MALRSCLLLLLVLGVPVFGSGYTVPEFNTSRLNVQLALLPQLFSRRAPSSPVALEAAIDPILSKHFAQMQKAMVAREDFFSIVEGEEFEADLRTTYVTFDFSKFKNMAARVSPGDFIAIMDFIMAHELAHHFQYALDLTDSVKLSVPIEGFDINVPPMDRAERDPLETEVEWREWRRLYDLKDFNYHATTDAIAVLILAKSRIDFSGGDLFFKLFLKHPRIFVGKREDLAPLRQATLRRQKSISNFIQENMHK